MAQQLSPELNQRIIELLTPFMTIQERHAYIDPWCIGYTNLYSQINWSGADRTFTTHIVTIFLRYGSFKSGKMPLQHLLESVHKAMGLEDQAEVDTILHILQETRILNNGSEPWRAPPSDPSMSQSSQMQSSDETVTRWFTKPNNRFVMAVVASLMIMGFISIVYLGINFLTSKPTGEVSSIVDTMSPSTTAIPKTPATSLPILIVTNTPIPTPTDVIITQAEMYNMSASVHSYCTSLVGYKTQEEIKSVLANGLGFDGPLNELRFYNGEIFGEVCAAGRQLEGHEAISLMVQSLRKQGVDDSIIVSAMADAEIVAMAA